MPHLTLMITLGSALLFLSACAGSPKVIDNKFGFAVKNMVKNQIYDPATLKHPPTEQVTGQNATKAIMDSHKIYGISEVSKEQTKTSVLANKQ